VAGKRLGDELNQTFHKGLLAPQAKLARSAKPFRRISSDESPEGMPGRAKPGEVTAYSILSGGMGLRKGGIRSHLDFVSPLFSGLGPFEWGLKKVLRDA
jgi:hypothetical protein